MASSNPKRIKTEHGEPEAAPPATTTIRAYLEAKQQEASTKGDKNVIKLLPSTGDIPDNDSTTLHEVYVLAKADGEVKVASQCFDRIFQHLFLIKQDPSKPASTNEMLSVTNKLKEEIRIVVSELKAQYLSPKTLGAPAALGSRHKSLSSSPMLSPRIRMSTEERVGSRKSMSKLAGYGHLSTKNLFYQQMFENLPEQTQKNLLDHSIEGCDNPLDKCRLLILTLTVFGETVDIYGNRLLKTLIEFTEPNQKTEEEPTNINPRSVMMMRYAKSLLVLDALPLVLNLTTLDKIDIGLGYMSELILDFFSNHCLEIISQEYELHELHDGVKKAIASRILGTDHSSTADEAVLIDVLVNTLNLLKDKLLDSITDNQIRESIDSIVLFLDGTSDNNLPINFDKINKIIQDLKLDEIPSDILLGSDTKSGTNQPVIVTPPKGRGRPKKQPQPATSTYDPETRKNLQTMAEELQTVFFLVVQNMFVNSASYLKNTQSRILLDFGNSLVQKIEIESPKSSSQRSSRSKALQQQNQPEPPAQGNPPKKEKPDQAIMNRKCFKDTSDSFLNSSQSKAMDLNILNSLAKAQRALNYLESESCILGKLWKKFKNINKSDNLKWYKRISVDRMLLSGQQEQAISLLESQLECVKEETETKLEQNNQSTKNVSSITATPTSNPVSANYLRSSIQLVSCHARLGDKVKAFQVLEEFLCKLKESYSAPDDEKYPSENLRDEYRTVVGFETRQSMGFLFFDFWSLLRYVSNLLMDILKKLSSSTNVPDSLIGHTIILSQFDWPKDLSLYNRCLDWIRLHKPKSTTPQSLSATTKFTYPNFFTYARHPSIIEDFMSLLCKGFTLDIKSKDINFINFSQGLNTRGATATRSGKAITTRGVNKTFKEDLKVALIAQMKCSSTVISFDVLTDFLQSSLIPELVNLDK